MRLDAGDTHRRDIPGEALNPAHPVGRPRADSEMSGGGCLQSPVRPYPGGTVRRPFYLLDNPFVTPRRFVGLDVLSPKRKSGTTITSPFGVSYLAATDVVLPRHGVIGRKGERLPGSPCATPDDYAWSVKTLTGL